MTYDGKKSSLQQELITAVKRFINLSPGVDIINNLCA